MWLDRPVPRVADFVFREDCGFELRMLSELRPQTQHTIRPIDRSLSSLVNLRDVMLCYPVHDYRPSAHLRHERAVDPGNPGLRYKAIIHKYTLVLSTVQNLIRPHPSVTGRECSRCSRGAVHAAR